MSIRYNYNRKFSPPAACAYVSIAQPINSGRLTQRIPAQLDSGADITVIPVALVEQLQLVQLGELAIAGFDGPVSTYPTYLVNVGIDINRLPHRWAKVPVLASDEQDIVPLGRDVLNRYRVTLNGPSLVVEIDAPS